MEKILIVEDTKENLKKINLIYMKGLQEIGMRKLIIL